MPPKIEKANIPRALREQVWVTYSGRVFDHKCLVPWCTNTISVFDFHVGHDIPESHGGTLDITNLRPICARCNLSMGSQYTFGEWSAISKPYEKKGWFSFFKWRKSNANDKPPA